VKETHVRGWPKKKFDGAKLVLSYVKLLILVHFFFIHFVMVLPNDDFSSLSYCG
jgi:hypothetical protein